MYRRDYIRSNQLRTKKFSFFCENKTVENLTTKIALILLAIPKNLAFLHRNDIVVVYFMNIHPNILIYLKLVRTNVDSS